MIGCSFDLIESRGGLTAGRSAPFRPPAGLPWSVRRPPPGVPFWLGITAEEAARKVLQKIYAEKLKLALALFSTNPSRPALSFRCGLVRREIATRPNTRRKEKNSRPA